MYFVTDKKKRGLDSDKERFETMNEKEKIFKPERENPNSSKTSISEENENKDDLYTDSTEESYEEEKDQNIDLCRKNPVPHDSGGYNTYDDTKKGDTNLQNSENNDYFEPNNYPEVKKDQNIVSVYFHEFTSASQKLFYFIPVKLIYYGRCFYTLYAQWVAVLIIISAVLKFIE